MNYFVNSENHPYYHWQLELLIESFKYNKCEESLLITVAENDNTKYNCNNFVNHKRLVGYQNIGKMRGYLPLNELYGLMWATASDQIQQPFALIQPDVVLRSPLDISFASYSELIFYPDPFFTLDLAAKEVGPFWEWTKKNKSDYESKWISLSSILVFSKIPIEIFQMVVKQAELFIVQQLINGQEIWKHTCRLALATIISEFADQISCRGDYSLVEEAMGGGNSYFISYEKGILPDFHKSMFSYLSPNYVSMGDPLKILAEKSICPNAHYLSNLAKRTLANR